MFIPYKKDGVRRIGIYYAVRTHIPEIEFKIASASLKAEEERKQKAKEKRARKLAKKKL